MAERLRDFARVACWRGRIVAVPALDLPESDRLAHGFAHHFIYDTSRLRREPGYQEIVPHEESLLRTLGIERAA